MELKGKIKQFFGFLASWAIKKHNISIIVVCGWYGTEVTREFVYTVLNTKYNVRRNIHNLKREISFPLAVLGYNEEKRNWLEWLGLILKALFRLVFGSRNQHYLVLNINKSNSGIFDYYGL
jgi:hypothetical protein